MIRTRRLGDHTLLLSGPAGGKYPDANALLVHGTGRTVLLDAPLSLVDGDPPAELPWPPDVVVLSHCHEDHVPGLVRDDLRELPLYVHVDDHPAMASLEGFLDGFGTPEPGRSLWRRAAVERFHFVPRPDAVGFEDGARWDLGGVVVTARHAPGHTAGHCVLRIEPDDVVFLGDVDLSGFGPYYGDASSSLEDFEATLAELADWRARWFVSGHHIGAVDQETFADRLGRYRRRIDEREDAMLEFLAEPRSLQEMVAHRFIYRPGDDVDNVEWVEERSIRQHLDRLLSSGIVRRDGDRWQRA